MPSSKERKLLKERRRGVTLPPEPSYTNSEYEFFEWCKGNPNNITFTKKNFRDFKERMLVTEKWMMMYLQ